MASPQEFVLTLIASAGFSSLLSVAGIWLARTWISERIHRSIQHEYDQKLAAFNAELRAESDKQAAILQASIEREADKLRFATSTIGETQKVAIERRLVGIETLWGSVLAARENVPAVMGFIDILTVDEYKTSKDRPHFKQLMGDLSVEKMAKMFKDNVGSIERVRPYVGEYLWALLGTYQALILRTALLLHWGKEDSEKLNWHQDSGIQQLLKTSLTPQELEAFEAVRIGKIGWLQRTYEQKMLAAMQLIVSGEQFGDEALKQAHQMEEKVQRLKPGGADAQAAQRRLPPG